MELNGHFYCASFFVPHLSHHGVDEFLKLEVSAVIMKKQIIQITWTFDYSQDQIHEYFLSNQTVININ